MIGRSTIFGTVREVLSSAESETRERKWECIRELDGRIRVVQTRKAGVNCMSGNAKCILIKSGTADTTSSLFLETEFFFCQEKVRGAILEMRNGRWDL